MSCGSPSEGVGRRHSDTYVNKVRRAKLTQDGTIAKAFALVCGWFVSRIGSSDDQLLPA